MSFQISGLPASCFASLFPLSDEALSRQGAMRMPAGNGFPCRITLEEAEPGEPVLLLPFEHQPGRSPYRSSGPIFVRQWTSQVPLWEPNMVPPSFRSRLYSARAYNEKDSMIDAEVEEGRVIERVIERFLADPQPPIFTSTMPAAVATPHALTGHGRHDLQGRRRNLSVPTGSG